MLYSLSLAILKQTLSQQTDTVKLYKERLQKAQNELIRVSKHSSIYNVIMLPKGEKHILVTLSSCISHNCMSGCLSRPYFVFFY